MSTWEYCAVYLVATYMHGSGGEPQELLKVKYPGAPAVDASNAFGAVGLLNELGKVGWELVDVETGTFYLKRRVK